MHRTAIRVGCRAPRAWRVHAMNSDAHSPSRTARPRDEARCTRHTLARCGGCGRAAGGRRQPELAGVSAVSHHAESDALPDLDAISDGDVLPYGNAVPDVHAGAP